VLGVRGALFVAGGMLPAAVALTRRSLVRLDTRAVARIEVLDLLARVPLFAALRVDALEDVAARLRAEHHAAGEVVVRQGDASAEDRYLVADGELTVEIDGYAVAVLGPGGQFGERALLRETTRAATVRTRTDVLLYALGRRDFLAALAGGDLAGATLDGRAGEPIRVEPAAALAARSWSGSTPPRSPRSRHAGRSGSSCRAPRSSAAAIVTTPTMSC